jgi:hypothetical protein
MNYAGRDPEKILSESQEIVRRFRHEESGSWNDLIAGKCGLVVCNGKAR